MTGRVVHVADGDSFTLLVAGQRTQIRMASIDAPEIGRERDQPGQPMGRRSRQALSDLIAGKTLTVSCFEQDHYGRSVCDVPLSQGKTANQMQVASGMAWANRERGGQFMRDPSMPTLERAARQAGIGVWQPGLKAVQPWVWRHQCWKQQQC